MNQDLQLKLQGWVDGELNESDACRMAQLAANDPAAARLAAELRGLKTAMTGAEMARAVPDGREFYWSKICRQIESESRPSSAARAPTPLLDSWRRLALPLTGLAAAACVALVMMRPSIPLPFVSCDEVTATSDAMETMTYHDQATGLTVVWLQDNAAAQPMPASAVQDDNSVETD